MHQLNIDADNRIQVCPFTPFFTATCRLCAYNQVLDTIESLGNARKSQYAAFVREEGVLVVWADTVQSLIPTAKTIEACLIDFLWADEIDEFQTHSTISKHSRSPLSRLGMTSRSTTTMGTNAQTPSTNVTTPSVFGDKHEMRLEQMPDQLPIPSEKEMVNTDVDMEDPYKAKLIADRKLRPVALIASMVSGLSVALAVTLLSLGLRM